MDSSGNLEGCLNLLKGNTDEQRLVGLLVATKYVQGDDKESILKVFDAIGIQFINRLLKSGGTGDVQVTSNETKQEQPYLQLALSILSAFCRVSELASLDEIIAKVPSLVRILAENQEDAVVVDCYECLLAVGSASEKGLLCLQQSRALPVIARHLSNSPADAASVQLGVKLMQILLASTLTEMEIVEYAEDITMAIPALAKLLAFEQSSLKFEVLLLLRTLCSSNMLVRVGIALKNKSHDSAWPGHVRMGIGQILQNRVVADQKHLALELAGSMVELLGGTWLLGPMFVPEEAKAVPLDRFFLLLVETLRVETAVLLNELAQVRLDLEYAGACKSEELTRKQHILATCYALLENIMNVITEKPDDTRKMSESTLTKTMIALDEVTGVIFELLQDAKRHGVTKGDDLLASARLVGRYLAEAPSAHRKQFLSLLQYLFSITTEGEQRPFLAVHFLLPALCQITMDVDGCKALVSGGGHKQVIDYMLAAIQSTGQGPSGLIVEACDTILNLLLKRNRSIADFRASDFVSVLSVLPTWAVNMSKAMEISLAACICVMVLDLASEENFVQMTSMGVLSNVYNLIIKILEYCQQSDTSEEPAEEEDLWDITISTCAGLLDRYPSLKHAIRSSAWLQQLLQEVSLTEAVVKDITINPSLQLLLISLLID